MEPNESEPDPATKADDPPTSTSEDVESLPETASLAPVPSGVPAQIGRYTLKRVIASGGMGTVYLAVQEHPRRTVAVKVMRSGIASRSALRRFEYEAQILARLQHPGIAQIYEAGTHDDGSGAVPYFAMEFVPGAKPIVEYVREKKLEVDEALALFAKVCEAIAHGHQKGIIHRDLKPSNILIDSFGAPKIIDFGVARATDSDLAVTTLQTDVGQLIGTLQYMSPEQCDADPHGLDVRSDVYALGVVLYEFVTGALPYDVSSAAIYEAVRIIRETSPARPRTHNGTIRKDIEVIVLKALEKERDRRYQSAGELAQDIRRYLNAEPIAARPPSMLYQVRMFARRNAALFSITAVAVVLLVGAAVTSTLLAIAADEATAQAEKDKGAALWAQAQEERQRRIAVSKTAEAERAARDAAAAEARATAAAELAKRRAYVSDIAATEAAVRSNDFATALRRLERVPAGLRDWEWGYLRRQLGLAIITLSGHEAPVEHVAFSPDGEHIATAAADTLRLWRVADGSEVWKIEVGTVIRALTFSSVGMRLAVAGDDRVVRLLNAKTGARIHRLRGHDADITDVAYAPDSRRLVSVGEDGALRVWDPVSGTCETPTAAAPGALRCVTYDAGGRRLVTGGDDGAVRRWDAATGEPRGVLGRHEGPVLAAVTEGTFVATASSDRTVRIWSANGDGADVTRLADQGGPVRAVAIEPGGSIVASVTGGRTVRLEDARTARLVTQFAGHDGAIIALAYSPAGDRLATGSDDRTVRIWPARVVVDLSHLRQHESPVRAIAVGADDRMAAGLENGGIVLWRRGEFDRPRTVARHAGGVTTIALSPDGRWLASSGEDRSAVVWDVASGRRARTLSIDDDTVTDVAFGPDGRTLATAGRNGSISIWEVATGERLRRLDAHDGYVSGVTFRAGPSAGPQLVSASGDGTLRMWDITTWSEPRTLVGHVSDIVTMAVSGDGARIATGSFDRTIRLWDSAKGDDLGALRIEANDVLSVDFNPNASRLVAGYADGSVVLWDVVLREPVLILRGHRQQVNCVRFSADGRTIVSGSDDGSIRAWRSDRAP